MRIIFTRARESPMTQKNFQNVCVKDVNELKNEHKEVREMHN